MAQSSVKQRSAWDEILTEIRKEIGAHAFNTWLRPTRQERLDHGTLFIAVPNRESQAAGERFGPQIERAIQRLALSADVAKVEFVCPTAAATAPAPAAPVARPLQTRFDFDSGVNSLNPRYTFEHFVVGKSNELAHAACKGTADRPGRAYNPLFLYGGVGMGKTHLMHAIGHRSHAVAPHLRIEYMTAERFTNEMITALRTEQMIAFRDRYRSIDVLLIDDIHFIANKERTQEEFFHTFNALHGAQKQIVIASDRPPREMSDLQERLLSRFEWGLIADLQPPDLETKIAILMEKSQAECSAHPGTPELTQEVAEFIARKIKSNVRELEGALTRLTAYCALKDVPIAIPVAQEALRHILAQQERKLDLETIAKTVAEAFSLSVGELKAKNNAARIVRPRQVAMFLTKQLTEASLPEIGRFYGGKHHSTVLHSIRKVEQERQQDRALQNTLTRLGDQLS